MIKPILFPFTHLSQVQIETMYSFFSSFYFMPIASDFNNDKRLDSLLTEGKLMPVFTPGNELKRVQRQADEFLQWVQTNKGNENNLKVLLKDSPYFTSDTAVTSIRSDIKRNARSWESEVRQGAVLNQSLLFLKFAKISDGQNEKIDLELNALNKSQKDLFSTLKGLYPDGQESLPESSFMEENDPGMYMTRERLEAWLTYFTDTERIDNRKQDILFVSTSPSVYEHLVSISEVVINALDIENIKVHENECKNKNEWLRSIGNYIERALQSGGGEIEETGMLQPIDGCNISGVFKLTFLSGSDIEKTFNAPGKKIPICLVKLK
jgi:hypothetical protein